MDENQVPQNGDPTPEIAEVGEPVAPPVPPVEPPPTSASYPPPVPPVAPPPPADGSGRTLGIVIGVVAACVLVLVGLGIAIFLLVQSTLRSLDAQAPQSAPVAEETSGPRDEPTDAPEDTGSASPEILPLVSGAAGSPVAVDPTLCPTECFDTEVFAEIGLSAEDYAGLAALTQEEAWGDYADSTPSKEYTYSARYWTDGEGTPAECFPVYVQVPVATPLDVRPETTGETIAYLGYYSNTSGYSGLQESARVFGSSALAEVHMSTFRDLVAGCTEYEIGTGSSYWTAEVTPAPALELPDSVAAIGWVEDSPFGRYYAIDLQRGNLVIRAAMYTDGEVTEEQYRDYVVSLAEQLADLPAR